MAFARISHSALFTLVMIGCLATIITSGILVGEYNVEHEMPPTEGIETRTRYLLFCGIWTFLLSLVSILGLSSSPDHLLFSIAGHLVWLLVTLVLFVSGAAALTAVIRGEHYNHQTRLEILAGFAWADSILIFLAILLILSVGLGRRNGLGGSLLASPSAA
ncbi:uncharacterized protein MELLADRAFT_57488 [Melampsora larici-populina 98AG31]|uniref:MARVEL domain-containing protein n=1 Tax=Melampsora larici-populina (strain 98AG31 / pathotype 3-4-7) TaxID=747676 RepID=F4S2S8_MELLP|nr:uncharacterized protein MELLADRAFT_57488 [Melampsora larici-populina 98AG31]EGG01052.1 hypothetical protein MELLADRAFT_57488 [Melampsora larici-populina 98AG31]